MGERSANDLGKTWQIVAEGLNNATVLRNHRPTTALAAKFSIEFAMAAALVAREVGLAQLADGFVRSAPVARLFERVHVMPSSSELGGVDVEFQLVLNYPRLQTRKEVEFCLFSERVFMTITLVSKQFVARFSARMTALVEGTGKSVRYFGYWVRGEPVPNVQRPS